MGSGSIDVTTRADLSAPIQFGPGAGGGADGMRFD
jgi:hypothetical protein